MGEAQNLALKLTLFIFFRQICDFQKKSTTTALNRTIVSHLIASLLAIQKIKGCLQVYL
jgi:hypothetical protein